MGRYLSLEPPLQGVYVLFRYELAVKEVLQQLKFARQKQWAARLRQELELEESFWQQLRLRGNLVFTAVPTDAGRLRERGYDLPELLFKQVVMDRGFTWQGLLARVRPTSPQFGLSPVERRLNLEDCFRVQGDVRGKNIILVDDIFTTGATMQEAAAALRAAGAQRVTGLALCGALGNFK